MQWEDQIDFRMELGKFNPTEAAMLACEEARKKIILGLKNLLKNFQTKDFVDFVLLLIVGVLCFFLGWCYCFLKNFMRQGFN